MPWIEAVNRFWFHEISADDWFSGSPAIDELIRTRFGQLYSDLKQNPPPSDDLTAHGYLALVIVFDQFPRNLFRNSPEAYATDDLALSISSKAIDKGLDAALDPNERHFLYMPFMHSESRDIQKRSLELFAALNDTYVLDYARHHQAIVERFGRFPHRNKILDRESTEAELEFLRTTG